MITSILTFLTTHRRKLVSVISIPLIYHIISNQLIHYKTSYFLTIGSILFASVKKISWLDFKQNILYKIPIEKLIVSNNVVIVHLLNNPFIKYTFTVASNEFINNQIELFNSNIKSKEDDLFGFEHQQETHSLQRIPLTFEQPPSSIFSFTDLFKIIIILVMLMIFLFRSSATPRGALPSLIETPNYEVLKPTTTLDDVIGAEVKHEVMDLVDILMNPEMYATMGAKTPKGILLEGPPGTGKTMLARAVANYSNAKLYYVSASSFNQTFVGVGSNRLVELFSKAKLTKPSIIFIDELDAIGKKRGARAGIANDDRESTLNTMLTLMDGFEPNDGTLVIAATNRKSILDDALLRPGRFDRTVNFELPNGTERYQMFVKLLNAMPCALEHDTAATATTATTATSATTATTATKNSAPPSVSITPNPTSNITQERYIETPIVAKTIFIEQYSKELGRRTMGMSGADISKVINEAVIHAVKSKKTSVNWDDLNFALDYTSLGPTKRMKIISDEQKRIVAYHETGHALIAYLLPCAANPTKVSIVPRGNSMLGFSQSVPTEEKKLFSKQDLIDHMHVLIAGRVAERIKFNSITTGASDDLERLTKSARELVMRYGMDNTFGSMVLLSDCQYSNETYRAIDQTVQEIIKTTESAVEKMLLKHTESFEAIATLLFEKETIVEADIIQVVNACKTQ